MSFQSIPDSSTTVKGIVQLAGDLAGTATAPTVVASSTSVAGKVELLTDAETITGTDTTRAMTAANHTAYVPDTCVIYKSADQAITTATWTIPTMNSEVMDTNTMHDTTTNNSRIYATRAGTYDVRALIRFAANATGERDLFVSKNSGGTPAGGTIVGADSKPGHASITPYLVWTGFVPLAAGDYLEMHIYQNSGGNLNQLGALGNSTLNMARIGA